MSARWRLAAFAIQLLIITCVTQAAIGFPLSSATWFSSLIALSINTQLLEPYFPRPVDVLANSIVGLLFYVLAPKSIAAPGWHALAVALAGATVVSVTAVFFGAGRAEGPLLLVARASRVLSGAFSAAAIYSAVFWLGLLDSVGGVDQRFWAIALAWLLVLSIGAVNWQALWATASGGPLPASPEGLIGPSRLLIAGPEMPPQGQAVVLSGGGQTANGTVLTRVRRKTDVWAAIHINDGVACEKLLLASTLTISGGEEVEPPVLGMVESSSSHVGLVFSPTRTLRIGDVVAVSSEGGLVLYQIGRAELTDVRVKGGEHIAVQARAAQIGLLDSSTMRLTRYRWVPAPGASVTIAPPAPPWVISQERFLLGHLIGTDIPIFLDVASLCEGHLAILGMTRMGKTTLASRLAWRLCSDRPVVVMDQTGEYRNKGHLPTYDPTKHDSIPSLSVFEPAAGKAIPDEGLAQLKYFANKGYQEYKTGTPLSRVVLVDEAHQFVPEPALLGFGAPGREAAITFGMYAMQVRKYGLALVLISQRTAVVAKTALSQCENVIAFKSVDQTGLDYLEGLLGPQARDVLPTLGQGEAYVSGPAISSDYPVVITIARDIAGPADSDSGCAGAG